MTRSLPRRLAAPPVAAAGFAVVAGTGKSSPWPRRHRSRAGGLLQPAVIGIGARGRIESPGCQEIERLEFRALFRTGAEKGLIENPVPWFQFRDMRSLTSHVYDERKAAEVYGVLPELLAAVRQLLQRLKNG